MAYASSTTVLQLVPGIVTTDSATVDALNAHIRRADDTINGKIAKRYSVPFTSTAIPPLVRTIAEDLTAGFLFRSLFTRDSQNRNDWTEDLMKRAYEMLDQIADGEIDLADTSGALLSERDSTNKIDISTENYYPIFDVDTDTSWNIDSDRLDDISDRKL